MRHCASATKGEYLQSLHLDLILLCLSIQTTVLHSLSLELEDRIAWFTLNFRDHWMPSFVTSLSLSLPPSSH